MAILFYPAPGTVLICDFDTGFVSPEMTKKRRVVIVSPKAGNKHICSVVPLSTSEPYTILEHHYALPAGEYPFLHPTKTVWAKCDMVTCVSRERLDRIKVKGKYKSFSLNKDDFQNIKNALAAHFEII